MKRIALVLLCAIATATARADDLSVERPKTPAEVNRQEQQKADAERRAKKALEQKPVTYSGFLTELSRSEKKSRFLSLRKPKDPKTDYRYVHFDERTDRPKGFVLFSLDF